MACATIVIQVKKGTVQQVIADRNVKVILIDHDMDDGPTEIEADVSTGYVQDIENEVQGSRE